MIIKIPHAFPVPWPASSREELFFIDPFQQSERVKEKEKEGWLGKHALRK